MKLFSYVVARDYGFAPNPFYGICTLATCKPRIRASANVGDWVVGIGSSIRNREKRIVYAMRVTEAIAFTSYWTDPRFLKKRPNLRGSKKQAFGDNIYSKDLNIGTWHQANSHHSHEDGSVDHGNVVADTQTNRVLVSDDYIYWGGSGPEMPDAFFDYGPDHLTIRVVRNHKSDFSTEFIQAFIDWIRGLGLKGYQGEPLDWIRTP